MDESLILQLIGSFPQIPGKKVFQKLCYFLQEAEGARLGVRFRMKHYGPYSEELEAGLDDLAERRMVLVQGSSEEGFHISLPADPPAEPEELSAENEAAIGRLQQHFHSDLNRGLTLELLATLHLLSRGKSYSGEEKDKQRLIDEVRAWKGRKFAPSFVQQQITRLEEMGYLVPSIVH